MINRSVCSLGIYVALFVVGLDISANSFMGMDREWHLFGDLSTLNCTMYQLVWIRYAKMHHPRRRTTPIFFCSICSNRHHWLQFLGVKISVYCKKVRLLKKPFIKNDSHLNKIFVLTTWWVACWWDWSSHAQIYPLIYINCLENNKFIIP